MRAPLSSPCRALIGPAIALSLVACTRPAPERAPPPAAEVVRAALAEGEAAWAGRGDPARLAVALDAFRRVAAARPGDPEAELRLARAEAFRALAAGEAVESRSAHDASARAAERALRTLAPAFAAAVDAGRLPAEAAGAVGPTGAEPLYLLALGRMGAARATGHAAVLAVKDHVLALMEQAAALDERLDQGGPLRALGAWQAMLPAAAGGGVAAARARFARAAELFPDEPWRRVLEAGTLAVLLQDGAAFDRLLGEVRAMTPSGERAPEAELARRRATALLERRARLF